MKLSILGTRGIPAKHGGFETFAERLALYLVSRGWEVTVYCQGTGKGIVRVSTWEGIRLVNIPVAASGAKGTIIFDFKAAVHAMKEKRPVLTLGYNTALFCILYRLARIPNLINMDGIEWRRQKWNHIERAWLYLNERLGCLIGNHLIADHPEIEKHLRSRVSARKITMISYGSDELVSPDVASVQRYELLQNKYCIVVARLEPENSIQEIVDAFSRKKRGVKLVLLGHFDPEANSYHRMVSQLASEEVVFLGALYERPIVNALRYNARLYIHGHTVGGSNPSLIEALGAGSAVLAHDNEFNRWVAGPGACYFKDSDDCARQFDVILEDGHKLEQMKHASIQRHRQDFSWANILGKYERLLLIWQRVK